MNKLIVLAMLGGMAVAQTQPAPKKWQDATHTIYEPYTFTDKELSGISLNAGDLHGCYWGNWDNGKQACSIHITFPASTQSVVTCSPVAADYDGTQHIICWYVPAPPKERK